MSIVFLRSVSRRLAILGLVVGAEIGLTLTASAETVDPYIVDGVMADVTADSATQARDRALAQAQVDAAEILFRRLLPQGAAPKISPQEAAGLISSFQIADERRSQVHYAAMVTYRFAPDKVRGFLAGRGLTPFDRVAPARLVLPLLVEGDRKKLWEDDNPWLQAWQTRKSMGGLVPLVAPDGDLEDISAVGAGTLGNEAGLEKLRQKYQVTEIIVAVLSRGESGSTLMLTRKMPQGSRDLAPITWPLGSADDASAAFRLLIQDATAAIDQSWKDDSQLASGTEQLLVVEVPVQTLGDWVDIDRRLASVPAIRKKQLMSIEPTRRLIELSFAGEQRLLDGQLAQVGLVMTQDAAKGGWVLRRTGSNSLAPSP